MRVTKAMRDAEHAAWRAQTRANAWLECYSEGARVLDPVYMETTRRRDAAERESSEAEREGSE